MVQRDLHRLRQSSRIGVLRIAHLLRDGRPGGRRSQLQREEMDWSAPLSLESTSNRGLDALSCISPTFCMAVDYYGRALSYNGKKWTAPRSIESSSDPIDSVSCTTPLFCAAVDF